MTTEKQDRSTKEVSKKVSIVRRNLLIGAAGAPLLLTLQAKSLLADTLDDHTAQSAVGAPFSNVLEVSGGSTALENELYSRLQSGSEAERAYYGTPGSSYVVEGNDGALLFGWYLDETSSTIAFTNDYEKKKIQAAVPSSLEGAAIASDYTTNPLMISITPNSGKKLLYDGSEITGLVVEGTTLADFLSEFGKVEVVNA